MLSDQLFSSPTLKTITIRLSDDADRLHGEACQELALCALAAALLVISDSSSPAWTVQAVPGARLLYQLTPLSDHHVPTADAWRMIDVLRSRPEVASARPTFVVVSGVPA
jgi:hypothetical protein